MNNCFKKEDLVIVCCPLLSSEKRIEKILRFEGNYAVFYGNSGKIQLEFCEKYIY